MSNRNLMTPEEIMNMVDALNQSISELEIRTERSLSRLVERIREVEYDVRCLERNAKC